MRRLSDEDFANLLSFRTELRRFERWSETQAKAAGLTHAQHQLLLAVKGHADPRGPTVGDLGDYLLLRHHSAVELLNRAQAGGFVERTDDPDDGRVVRVRLTRLGESRLRDLAELHLAELRRLRPALEHLSVES